MSAPGFAVVDANGEINVATVSPNDIGAMVNWLYIAGVFVPRGTSDDAILSAFNHHRNGARCAPVVVAAWGERG